VRSRTAGVIVATGAAIRYGVYSLSDRGWEALRSRRGIQPAPVPAATPVDPVSPEFANVVPEDTKSAPAPAASDTAALEKAIEAEDEAAVALEFEKYLMTHPELTEEMVLSSMRETSARPADRRRP
jgi:hypothetical protein